MRKRLLKAIACPSIAHWVAKSSWATCQYVKLCNWMWPDFFGELALYYGRDADCHRNNYQFKCTFNKQLAAISELQDGIPVVIWSSKATDRFLGKSIIDYDPPKFSELFHPDDYQQLIADSQKMRETGQMLNSEYRIFDKDKKIKILQLTRWFVRCDGREYDYTIAQDKTPQRLIQEVFDL